MPHCAKERVNFLKILFVYRLLKNLKVASFEKCKIVTYNELLEILGGKPINKTLQSLNVKSTIKMNFQRII
jgi:hypothetical protein